MTRKAICVHVHMSDNRETLCDAENSWLPVDIVDIISTIGRRCVTIKAVCIHVQLGTNRQLLRSETSVDSVIIIIIIMFT